MKIFETKMTTLVPAHDLFILLSVHPMWGEDGVGLPYQYNGDARRKIRIQNLVKENNMGIAQARLRLHSVTH